MRSFLLALLLPLCACQAQFPGGVCDPGCPQGQKCQADVCVPDTGCRTDGDCQDDSYCKDGVCLGWAGTTGPAYDVTCSRSVPAGVIAPRIVCEWGAPGASDSYPNHREVLSTPLVADFNFDGHRGGEFNTERPSIAVVTYDSLDGQCGLGPLNDGANYGIIRVLDGRTCQQQYVISEPVNGATTPAIGDLDGDGRPEIVAVSAAGGLIAFRFDPNQNRFVTLWRSHDAANMASNPVARLCQWAGPSLSDVDGDGRPEALLEGYVYDRTGKLIDGSLGLLSKTHDGGQFVVVTDMDRDGAPDLVTPRFRASWSQAAKKWQISNAYTGWYGADDHVAAADFGAVGATGTALDRTRLDGQAEVVVVTHGKAWLLSTDGRMVFGPVPLPGSKGGGPPTVGDFDGDGRAEFAAAGASSFTVLDPDCVPGGDVKYCASGRTDGILWSSQSQDVTSNVTGSSLFDFDGDGATEAVYADECYARVYDGRTGEVVFSQSHSSCTWHENPVVADVSGNFRAQLIVPSNRSCEAIIKCPAVDPAFRGLRCKVAADCPGSLPCDAGLCRCQTDGQCSSMASGGGFACRPAQAGTPGTGSTCQAVFTGMRSGVRVFGDVADRWVSSRPMWNQHAYFITNVNDDGTLPRRVDEKPNFTVAGLNNFRMNVQGQLRPTDAPDVTARKDGASTCSGGAATLSAVVCDRGAAPVGDGLPVAFYEGAQLLCVGRTATAMGPGQCRTVTCSASGLYAGLHQLTIVANDDGQGGKKATECTEGNNRATLPLSCS